MLMHTCRVDLGSSVSDGDDLGYQHNHVFYVNPDGGDFYYAWGGTSVSIDLFRSTGRGFARHPVWLLTGQEGLGQWDIYASTNMYSERPVPLTVLRTKEKDRR